MYKEMLSDYRYLGECKLQNTSVLHSEHPSVLCSSLGLNSVLE